MSVTSKIDQARINLITRSATSENTSVPSTKPVTQTRDLHIDPIKPSDDTILPESSDRACPETSTYQDPHSAQKVFEIPELSEMILLRLPMQDLLLAQRVSKPWKALIDGCSRLQQALFLWPASCGAVALICPVTNSRAACLDQFFDDQKQYFDQKTRSPSSRGTWSGPETFEAFKAPLSPNNTDDEGTERIVRYLHDCQLSLPCYPVRWGNTAADQGKYNVFFNTLFHTKVINADFCSNFPWQGGRERHRQREPLGQAVTDLTLDQKRAVEYECAYWRRMSITQPPIRRMILDPFLAQRTRIWSSNDRHIGFLAGDLLARFVMSELRFRPADLAFDFILNGWTAGMDLERLLNGVDIHGNYKVDYTIGSDDCGGEYGENSDETQEAHESDEIAEGEIEDLKEDHERWLEEDHEEDDSLDANDGEDVDENEVEEGREDEEESVDRGKNEEEQGSVDAVSLFLIPAGTPKNGTSGNKSGRVLRRRRKCEYA